MSEVEMFYTKICNKMGTNLQWDALPLNAQLQFTIAINTILDVCWAGGPKGRLSNE